MTRFYLVKLGDRVLFSTRFRDVCRFIAKFILVNCDEAFYNFSIQVVKKSYYERMIKKFSHHD